MFRLASILLISFFFVSTAFAQGGPQRDTHGDRAFRGDDRTRAVEDVASAIGEYYFDEVRAAEIAGMLQTHLANGEFDASTTPDELSQQLTTMLLEEDRHFAVNYVGREAVREATTHSGAEEGQYDGGGDRFAAMRARNFGFQEVSILPGNVGYIDMLEFAPIGAAGTTATAVLDFVANTDAVIFDMRQNHGGQPSMVQFLISHFLDSHESVAINTFISRDQEYPQQLNSLQHLPSAARPNVPLYVLVSGSTGSAGEAFPYHLQAMERATIVGQSTYGAANPGGMLLSDEGYEIFVSTGSARNPITGTNWEEVGVIPDVEVNAEHALDHALLLAYREIAATTDDEMRQQSMAWAIEEIEYRQSPTTMSETDMADFAGTYGPRNIFIVDGALTYRRGEQDPVTLRPLGEDRFLFDDAGRYRLSFQRNRRGDVVSLTLNSQDRPPSVSPRD